MTRNSENISNEQRLSAFSKLEQKAIIAFEGSFQYPFKTPQLIITALTHASVADKNDAATREDYERMEFLGDRVVNLIIADLLFHAFPKEKEGDLARRHTAFVRGEALARAARRIDVQNYLRLSSSEKAAGGADNDNILADVMESLIAALYLDAGYDTVRAFIDRTVGADIIAMDTPPVDSKTALQEWTQSLGRGLPSYKLSNRSGPDHAPEFTVTVSVPMDRKGTDVKRAHGTGASKRIAEKQAAKEMLALLKEDK